jgi:transcription-repair coupling factor (superfamily II helicase)
LQRVPPAALSTDAGFRVEAGMPLSLDELKVYLLRAGYVLDERVDEPGEAALCGTIDVFPGTDQQPFRLRLDDGIIAVIDRYDPVTQRTESSTSQVIHAPGIGGGPRREPRPPLFAWRGARNKGNG